MPSFPALSVPLLSTVSLVGTVYARTTLEGCTFAETVSERNEYSIVWYVPETGEICDVPVCGGGLDPFDYDNPACPEYTGTAPYEPSYLEEYEPRPTAVTAETAMDAAVTSAPDWTEEEVGEEADEVVPGDDESRSATTWSTRFSSTVATSSTEKARSTSTSIIGSSSVPLRPSPTLTSSAAMIASESAHGSTTVIRTSPVESSLPMPSPTTSSATVMASESARSSTSLIGSSPISLLPTPPLSPLPTTSLAVSVASETTKSTLSSLTTSSSVSVITPPPAPLQPAPLQPAPLQPAPPKLAPPKPAPPQPAPPQPAPPQPAPPTTSSANTGVGGSTTIIGSPTASVTPYPMMDDGAGSLRLSAGLGALGLLAAIIL
ncbi:hypothetical protein BDW68DRAFT_176232 [Aspergillus falconensis]